MKPYFSKLLTEQERAGSRNRSVKWGKRLQYDADSEYEKEPRRVPMSRHSWVHRGEGKSLTDVLSPLRGYLRKHVGQPWDKVYSALCKGLDRRTVSGLHVFQHLEWEVEREGLWVGAETGNVYDCRNSEVGRGFYVHPHTGILCYKEWPRWRAPEEKDPDEIAICEGKSYQRLQGIWYYTEWVKEDRATYHSKWAEWGRSPWNVSEKKIMLKVKQLNRRELRDLKLWNRVQ